MQIKQFILALAQSFRTFSDPVPCWGNPNSQLPTYLQHSVNIKSYIPYRAKGIYCCHDSKFQGLLFISYPLLTYVEQTKHSWPHNSVPRCFQHHLLPTFLRQNQSTNCCPYSSSVCPYPLQCPLLSTKTTHSCPHTYAIYNTELIRINSHQMSLTSTKPIHFTFLALVQCFRVCSYQCSPLLGQTKHNCEHIYNKLTKYLNQFLPMFACRQNQFPIYPDTYNLRVYFHPATPFWEQSKHSCHTLLINASESILTKRLLVLVVVHNQITVAQVLTEQHQGLFL